MAKRSNNSLGRRSYGGKPYDANNSFVKKMATKVTDLIPQRSWISKWFNTSQDNGDAADEDDNSVDGEEDTRQPPAKRPRIRMDITHPPGTFSIIARDKDSSDNHDSRIPNETDEYFLEPAIAGPSGACKFISSTPAVSTDVRTTNSQNSRTMSNATTARNNVASNGNDDNSESGESTSGCSSLIPQINRQEVATNSAYVTNLLGRNRFIDDKSSFANNLQSPRCLFLESGISRESSTSRRPSFNASMMNNNGSNFERSASLASPFYTGNVTFGGSNALGNYKRSRSLFNSANEYQLKIPRRTSVQVKPSNIEKIDETCMSQTAKRILEAMEAFSSPVSDAKKIPMRQQSEISIGKKRSRDDGITASPVVTTTRVGLRHLTRQLAVPTVPEMLKLRRRQKLQDTTAAARKIILAMSGLTPTPSWPATETTKNTSEAPTNLAIINEDYHLRTELDNTPKYHGKLRGKSWNNLDDEETPPIVNLPCIKLPITSLPKFEPLPKYTVPNVVTSNKNDTAETKNKQCDYKFASPIKITEASWNLKSINNFSFSKPLNPDKTSKSHINFTCTSQNEDTKVTNNAELDSDVTTNFIYTSSSTAPRLKAKTKQKFVTSEITEKTEISMISGKMEIDNVKAESTSANSPNLLIWECTECYIKNDSSDKTCVACKSSNSRVIEKNSNVSRFVTIDNDSVTMTKSKTRKSRDSVDTSFGRQFKMSKNQWECESCLVRNNMNNVKCLSCSSVKPNVTKKQQIPVDSSLLKSKITFTNDIAEKFKPAEGSWECNGCMLRNKSNVITCPCCSAAKPSSLTNESTTKKTIVAESSVASSETSKPADVTLMDKFKPSPSTWECKSCLVRNNDNSLACVCCSTPKPEVSAKITKEPGKIVENTGWGDKFKKPEGSWSCESCMLQNKSEINECVACNTLKPGVTAKTTQETTKPKFSFGVPNFGINDQSFEFGIKKSDVTSKTAAVSSDNFANGFDWSVDKATSGNVEPGKFTFGIVPKETEKASDTQKKTLENPIGGFVFASPKTTVKESGAKFVTKSNDVTVKTANDEKNVSMKFSFGMPKTVNKRPADDSTSVEVNTIGKTSSSKGQFVFGVPKSEISAENEKPKSEKTFIFGDTTRTTGINESNNGTKIKSSTVTSEEQHEKSLSVANPSSGTNSISAQSRNTPFAFNETNSNIPSTQTSALTPSFGQTVVSTSNPTFTITGNSTNQSDALHSNTQTSSKPLASNFGIHNSATPMQGFANVASTSTLNTSEKATSNDGKACFTSVEKPKSTFFGMSNEKKTFGTTIDKKTPIFGNTDNKLTQPFGTNEKSLTGSGTMFNSTATSSTSFGGNSAITAQPVFGSSSTPVFGGNTATPSFTSGSNTAGQTNIFAAAAGAGKTNVTAAAQANNPMLFSFGGGNSQQITGQSNTGGFSFVTDTVDTAASTANKPIFSFGNATGASQPGSSECFGGPSASAGSAGVVSSNSGTFGTPGSSVTNPSSSPFTFNAPSNKQEQTAFGQATSTIPSIFGAQQVSSGMGQQQVQNSSTFGTNAPAAASAAAAPSTGFSFGASAPSAVSGGFNFGGGMAQPAATPSGGFNFNAPSPSPAIAFDPNTRPSFNFTGGTAPTAFNAPQPVAARKIKKAVRRMQQR